MRIGSLMLLFWVAFALPARAQTTTATLLGTVTDAQKAVLPGAVVTSRNVETGAETTAVADANGRYRLAALRPGTYELRAELAGFASAARLGLQLFVGQEVTIDLQMALAGVAESITITAAAPLVETTKSDVSTVVDREQIDALPLNGRNFADLTRLTPDVLSNDRIGGMQSSLSNTYFVDGVTNDRAWTGGNRSGYSSENIREFRVITQQYAAEYGQASGGVVNVVTRSGTNDFEQRLFLYHRGDNLDARNAFATAKAPFDRQQYGGFAGGPILRDRLFYFASYERTHEDQTAVVSTPVERGEFPNPSDQHQIFGKGDYQLTQAHALTLRVNEDRFDAENQGVGGQNTVGYGSTSVYRNHDFYSALTSVLGSASLNELRVQYARRPGGNIPNTPNVPQLAFASSNQGKSSANPQETTEWRFQIVDNFSWRHVGFGGEHDVKAGIDFSRAVLEGFFCNFCDGAFTFPRDVFDPNDPTTYPTTYTQRLGSSDFVIPNNIYAAFVQDSWRPRPNLTLNLGVRYDYESYAGILKDKNNVSPRLAVSFDPWNRGKTVLRGGGGLFQDQITLNQWLIIVLNVINAQEFIVLRNPGYPDPFGGTRQPPAPPNTELFDPNMNTPYAAHLTGGMKQELGEGFALSADYVFVRGYDQLRRRDLNAPPNGTLVRPNPSLGRQLIHESAGEREHHALLLSAERRFGARSRFQASYTLSSTKSDFEARNSTTLPTDQYDLSADWGPADADSRHNLTVTGHLVLPFDIQLAGILQLRSKEPFNVVSGRDTNNDSRLGDRPDPDPNGPFPINGVTEYGRFSIPLNRPGTLGRNAFRGPDFRQLDLRASKVISIGARRLELIAEAFNLTNRVNYGSYTSSIQSSLFGRPQSAMAPRQVQLGVRFDF
ncbi:MAG: TonB-dependent receptor domain-containing protein [Vicinamibacterales bacterium]